ncbi:MAG: TRAP transporter small permease [Desulfotignum sp.]|nr:TRAP transporter small permease [Desulfotignum sp.]
MELLSRINKYVNMALTLTGGVFLVGMILLTCANIFIRQFFVPIPGTFELMGYAGAVVTAFALGYTQFTNGHISVDVLVNAYPKPIKRLISVISHGVCCVFFGLAAWHVMQKALVLMRVGELSETLRIIYYPFTLAVAFGCLVLCLALITDFLKALFPPKERS